MEEMFEVPEEMSVTFSDQEEIFGMIHKIFFTKENKSYVVNIQFATEGEDAPHLRTVKYRKIFTEGRYAFQKFCKDFGAVMDDDSVDLSKVPGKLCVAEYNPESQSFQLRHVPDSEAPEWREYFRNLIIPGLESVPSIIENYLYLPKYQGKELLQAELLGFITGYNVAPDQWDSGDDTICFNVVAFNGTSPMKTRYYLNRIYGEGSDTYQYFGKKFDILDEYNDIFPDEILFIPCVVSLKKLKGNLYVSTIDPIEFENKYYERQAELLINWYRKEMQKKEKEVPKAKPFSGGGKLAKKKLEG